MPVAGVLPPAAVAFHQLSVPCRQLLRLSAGCWRFAISCRRFSSNCRRLTTSYRCLSVVAGVIPSVVGVFLSVAGRLSTRCRSYPPAAGAFLTKMLNQFKI